MSENLMVGTHKHSSKEYRDGWDRTFGKKNKQDKGDSTHDKDTKRTGRVKAVR